MNNKKIFLEGFFKKIDHLDYGVIDIDDNLKNSLENDIDVWVDKNSILDFVESLKIYSNKKNWILKTLEVSPRLNGKLENKYAILQPKYPYSVIQLDLWICFHWRSFPFIINNFKKYIFREVYFKKIKNDKALLIQVLKDILYKGDVTKKVSFRIKKVNDFSKKDFYFLTKKIYSKKNQSKIIDILNNKKISFNPNDFKFDIIFNNIKSFYLNQLKNSINYFRRLLYIKFFSQDGIHIVLLGPDGAGKTTLGNILFKSEFANDFFEKKFYNHTNFKLIPPLNKYFSFLKKSKKKYVPRNLKKLSLFKAMIYPIYYFFDYLMGHFWLYIKKTRGGSFVIFDRYFDEYFIQKTYDRVPRRFLKFIQFFIPKPTIYFLITSSSTEIHKRKKEMTLQEIDDQLIRFKKLIKNKKNGYYINNINSPEEVVNLMYKIIFNHI